MHPQPTRELELDDRAEELVRILPAARARLDRLKLELLGFGLRCRDLGGRRGTTKTRHWLGYPFTGADLHLGFSVSPGRGEHLPYSHWPVNPVDYVQNTDGYRGITAMHASRGSQSQRTSATSDAIVRVGPLSARARRRPSVPAGSAAAQPAAISRRISAR